MRELVVTCDRCGDRIQYDEDRCRVINGAMFLIPNISPKGDIIEDAQWVELCKGCVYHLGKFMKGII